MHLKSNILGLAGAAVTALGYTLDSLFHIFAKETSVKFYSYISFNFDFSKLIGSGLTWGNYFAGLVVWSLMTYVCLWIFAKLYNVWSK